MRRWGIILVALAALGRSVDAGAATAALQSRPATTDRGTSLWVRGTITNLTRTTSTGTKILIPNSTGTVTSSYLAGQLPASVTITMDGAMQLVGPGGVVNANRTFAGDITLTPSADRSSYTNDGTLTLMDPNEPGMEGEDVWWHQPCFFRSVIGSVGHLLGRCSCFGGDVEDPDGMTKRQAARAAYETWREIHRGSIRPGATYTEEGLEVETGVGVNPDAWVCRRVGDYPRGMVPEGSRVDNCSRCGERIVFNPARSVEAPKVCMQCHGIRPLPFPD